MQTTAAPAETATTAHEMPLDEAVKYVTGIEAFYRSTGAVASADALATVLSALPQWRDVATDPPPIASPRSEWHEDMGDVLWWKFPIVESPYIGSPLDLGGIAVISVDINGSRDQITMNVGGWPGYHTHFTPLPSAPVQP